MEGIPNGSNHKKDDRGAVQRAAEIDWARDSIQEQKTENLKNLSKEYQTTLKELVMLNEDLQKGNARIEKNPRMRELAIQLGREIQSKIDTAHTKAEKLKQDITNAGGNLSDYAPQ